MTLVPSSSLVTGHQPLVTAAKRLLACCKVPRVLGDVLAVIGHALQAQQHFDKDRPRLGLAGAGVIPFLVPFSGFPDAGYGFIVSADGRDVYFHRNSVRNERFEDMEEGMEVVFVEEQGLRGPQASSVKLR